MKEAALITKDATGTRAYSLLHVKAIEEVDDQRVIRGIATTPELDRVGDVVEPLGVKFKNPLPLLWQHRHDQPVGTVKFSKATDAGIEFEAKLPKITEPGALKDLIDMAWQSVKAQLVRGVSIGFRALEYSFMDNGGIRFSQTEVYELSLVTIPANAGALITSAKSLINYDTPRPAVVVSIKSPGVLGITHKPVEGKSMNVQDQIKSFQAARAAKVAALEAIMSKAAEAGVSLNGEEQKEFDAADAEVKSIDGHLKRLETMQRVQLDNAKAVTTVEPGKTHAPSTAASDSRDPVSRVIAVQKKLPPGVAFARLAGIMAAAKGSRADAIMKAQELFPEEKPLHSILKSVDLSNFELVKRAQELRTKAAVDIGTTLDTDYAAPLVQYQDMVSEFLEFLRPQTIIGRIPNLRRVPFNVRVPRQTTGGTAAWVGEGAPKPLTALAFDNVTLRYMKLATIAVITDELARFSSPSAETIIRDTLAGAIIQQMDSDFVNPANAGTANVKPASITNGVTGIASTGPAESDVIADIGSLFAPFIAANLTPANGVWIMSATTALALSLMRNPANGMSSFPGVSMTGGTFNGLPVVVSEAVGNIVILANASDILVADDGQVTIDTSREASVQMDDAPTNPPVGATVFVSLWQQNLLGIKAERYITWVKGRAAAVQYLSGVTWGQQNT